MSQWERDSIRFEGYDDPEPDEYPHEFEIPGLDDWVLRSPPEPDPHEYDVWLTQGTPERRLDTHARLLSGLPT